MQIYSPHRCLMLLAVLVLTVAGGCSDDDPVAPPNDGVLGPYPETAGGLMTEFGAAYEKLDHEGVLALLDPAFTMKLQPATVAEFPYCGTTLDRAEMEGVLGRLFSGRDLTLRNGGFMAATTGVSFSVLQAVENWEEVPAGEEFAGNQRAPFAVRFLVERGQSYPLSLVQGTVILYAKAVTADIAGQPKTYYILTGMADLTGYKAGSEDVNWGSLLALYYPPAE
jgi:hypothetical protein